MRPIQRVKNLTFPVFEGIKGGLLTQSLSEWIRFRRRGLGEPEQRSGRVYHAKVPVQPADFFSAQLVCALRVPMGARVASAQGNRRPAAHRVSETGGDPKPGGAAQ